MIRLRSTLMRRVMTALDATPSHVPVLVGGSGTGRSTLLHQLRDRIGRSSAHYVDVERTATTPERFLAAVSDTSPFPLIDTPAAGARAAFDATLAHLDRARGAGNGPATFLLDEFLEFRTFESFPGLRNVLHEFVDMLADSGNRFVLTSRYTARTVRLLKNASARFEVIHMPALTLEETQDLAGSLGARFEAEDAADREYAAQTILALADGRPSYVDALSRELASPGSGSTDAVSALVGLMAPDGALARECGYTYELRLHRARGYGALKAILEILAEEEGLTLTEISLRLQRTPGSTKDYLSWLEDVDLVAARQKRYSFTDPLLRVWVRLYCRVSTPSEEDIAREIHRYALPRLPQAEPRSEPALAMAASGTTDDDKKGWGIIEID